MEKFTQKQLRVLVRSGAAVDLTHASNYSEAKLQEGDEYSQMISAALDGGENSDVQNALCKYIEDNN